MKNTHFIGSAAVHMVCADLLLQAIHPTIAAEGLPYDLVADVDGRLLRIQVKGCTKANPRAARKRSPWAYQFTSSRNHRPNRLGSPADIKRYDRLVVDALAFVAIDIRVVAYIAVGAPFVSSLHLFPPGTPPYYRRGENQRRCIDQFPFCNLTRPR